MTGKRQNTSVAVVGAVGAAPVAVRALRAANSVRHAAWGSEVTSAGAVGCLALLLLEPVPAMAQLPLSIEQLLVTGKDLQVATAVDYFSSRPAPGADRRGQTLTTSLRYGLASRVELNARLRSASSRLRYTGGSERSEVQSVSVGVNWLAKRETRSPALLLELECDLYEEQEDDSNTLPGFRLLATAYQSFDPLVLSFTASAAWNDSYRVEGQRWEPGIDWSLSPQVNFAVNHRVTLIGGLTFRRSEELRIDGAVRQRSSEELAFSTGLGFTPAPRHTVFLTGQYSNASSGGLSLRWLYEL